MASLEHVLATLDALCDADPSLAESLYTVLTERRNRRKAADAGAPQDSDRDPATVGNRASYLTSERRTMGGLGEPIEDDRTPNLVAEYYGTVGGLFTPDREPSVAEKLAALWFAPKPAKKLTA